MILLSHPQPSYHPHRILLFTALAGTLCLALGCGPTETTPTITDKAIPGSGDSLPTDNTRVEPDTMITE